MDESREAKPWDLLNPSIGRVDKETANERYEICKSCINFISLTKQCKLCGCFMRMKTSLPNATCPIEKWGFSKKSNKEQGIE